ncbi:MAG TPA: TPM domain-containing protein [Pirellulaceae bacterium]|nr:TPM domain-containing protein [Pirellulaceae bacterium]
MKKASQLFTDAEKEAVEKAVGQAEKRTSGEIVPVVATASGRYDRAEDIFGVLFAILAVTVAWIMFQDVIVKVGDWAPRLTLVLGLPWIVVLILGGFGAGAALATRFPSLKLPFLTQREMQEEVERSAGAVFQQSRVRRTAGGTGILLYISLFEHTVRVMGDDNIADKIDQQEWNEVCDLILEGVKAGRIADGLSKAIARCGDLLSKEFPIQPGDLNELTNELRLID